MPFKLSKPKILLIVGCSVMILLGSILSLASLYALGYLIGTVAINKELVVHRIPRFADHWESLQIVDGRYHVDEDEFWVEFVISDDFDIVELLKSSRYRKEGQHWISSIDSSVVIFRQNHTTLIVVYAEEYHKSRLVSWIESMD